MSRSVTPLTRLLAVVLIAATAALAGCQRAAVREKEVAQVVSNHHFDMTIKAYKDGQFVVDGAVLSALDTGSHFAYLKDQGQLPKTVLLVPSDETKVRKQHLQYMARMVLDYGFTVYYTNGGELTQINPVDTKARELQDYHAPAKPAQDQGSPAGGGYDPAGQ